MVTFRLISREGEIILSFLIIHRFFFFLAFYDIITCVSFAKVAEWKLGKVWMIGYWFR